MIATFHEVYVVYEGNAFVVYCDTLELTKDERDAYIAWYLEIE